MQPGDTKNRKGRMFPLTPRLHAVLEQHKERKTALEKAFARLKGPCSRRDEAACGGAAITRIERAAESPTNAEPLQPVHRVSTVSPVLHRIQRVTPSASRPLAHGR